MGLAKRFGLAINEHIEGADDNVALNGGYLYIYLADDLVHIASIPSPNFLAERSVDSVIENPDDFHDKLENEYSIVIFSSINGIHWYLAQYPDDDTTLMQLHYVVKLNENQLL